MNILVLPCGSEIGLEIRRAFRGVKGVTLIGASSVPDHGRFVFEHYHEGLPFVDDPAFVPALADFVRRERIDMIFPAHDSVVLELARREAELGCAVVGSPAETCEIARSKGRTYRHFAGVVRVPTVYDEAPAGGPYPLFLKPDVGQGSRGVHVARSAEDVAFYRRKDPSLLILEYLPGDEYTVCCFTDFRGELRFVGPRRRSRITNGISTATHNVEGAEFTEMARRLNAHVRFDGAWFFQAKRSAAGELALLEIAPRVGGSSGMNRVRGANLPVLSWYNRLKVPTAVLCNTFGVELDRAWSNAYKLDVAYDHVYLDFDDCLCIDGRLSDVVMRLVVQSLNDGKKVHILSRCAGGLTEKLERLRVRQLFDSVVNIGRDDRKSRHINALPAVFIDDSFGGIL